MIFISSRYAAHGDIGDRPYSLHLHQRADKDDNDASGIKDLHEELTRHILIIQERKGVVAIIKVAEQRCERKEDHGHCDEDRAYASEYRGDRILDIRSACYFPGVSDTRAEAHEGCGRTQEHCVNVDGNRLYETLLGRMRYICRSGGIRG